MGDSVVCILSNLYVLHTPQLLGWLEEKLPGAGKLPPEVSAIIPPLFSCLEDRSGDVRKKGQAVLPLFMAKVGYDTMLKHTGKLKVREWRGGGRMEVGEMDRRERERQNEANSMRISTAVSAACL